MAFPVMGLTSVNSCWNQAPDRIFISKSIHARDRALSGWTTAAHCQAIEPNFGNGQYIGGYNTVYAGTGKFGADEGLFIDSDDYGNGYALYAFDLTADLSEDDHFSLVK